MSFIGGLFGSDQGDTGSAGMRFQARGPEQYQLNDAWTNSQSGLGQQQQFINMLNQQGGVQNQSNVFNQQQGLAGQLALQASGGAGPSIAQSQYQQNMNAIAAQQAGAMGSQKGMSPALQARLVAQQGANAQQQAAGQYATLGAQEQWAAIQALQNQQANMANLSGTQVAQQQGALNSYNQAASNQQRNVYNYQTGATGANAGIANTTAQGQGAVFGGILNAAGGAMGMGGGKAHGGMVGYAGGGQVPCYADGGPIAMAPAASPNFGNDMMAAANQNFPSGMGADIYQAPMVAVQGPQSQAGQALQPSNDSAKQQAQPSGPSTGAGAIFEGMKNFGGALMGGGAKEQSQSMMGGGGSGGGGGGMMSMLPMLAMLAHGGAVDGEKQAKKMKPVPGKAKFRGDTEANDTVPARLSPGEIIIPRSIAMSPNAPEMAARFVAAVKAKQGRGIG